MMVRANIRYKCSNESFVISLPAKWSPDLKAAEVSVNALEQLSIARAKAGKPEINWSDIQFAEMPLNIVRRNMNGNLAIVCPIPYGDDPDWMFG